MAEKLTLSDASKWHMRQEAHFNGGREFSAYGWRCVQQPRLYRFDRYDRKTKNVTSTWRVDGSDHPDLAAAVEALNTPAVFDPDELQYLATYPEDFNPDLDPRDGMDWSMNDRLVNKGAVEWREGCARTTQSGRAALQQHKEGSNHG